MMTRTTTATAVYDVMGATVEFLTPPPPSDVPYCVMRGVIPPSTAVPMHSHHAPESFFVVSGEAQVLLEERGRLEWKDVRPGDFVHIPSDAKHAHRNRSSAPVVEIVITTPDLGEFFVEVGRPIPASGAVRPPTDGEIRRFVAAATQHHHWLATPEENAAVGIATTLRPSTSSFQPKAADHRPGPPSGA
jgi:quercetin dioxygenase-like cupin family protein